MQWMGSSQAAQGVPQFHALVWKMLGEPGQSSRLHKKNFLNQYVHKFLNLKAQLFQEQNRYLSQDCGPDHPYRKILIWENRFLLSNLNKGNLMKVSKTCTSTPSSSNLTALTCGLALTT